MALYSFLKTKKIIKFLIPLVMLIIGVYLVGNYLTNPERVVDDYLKALRAKDYKKAYSYFVPDKNPNLNLKAFEAWQDNNYKTSGPVKFTAVGKAEAGQNTAQVKYLLQRAKDDDKELNSMTLTRSGSILFLWPHWEIKIPSQDKKFLLNFEGAKLYLDGRETGLTTRRAQPFDIKVFKGQHKILFKAKNAKNLLVDEEHAVPRIEPSDAVVKDITETARDLAGRVKDAYNSNDNELLSTLLANGSDMIPNEKKYFSSINTFEEPYINVVDFYSPDKAKVDIWLYFNGIKIDPYYDYMGGFTIGSVIFVNRNGKWEIESIEKIGTPQQQQKGSGKNNKL